MASHFKYIDIKMELVPPLLLLNTFKEDKLIKKQIESNIW